MRYLLGGIFAMHFWDFFWGVLGRFFGGIFWEVLLVRYFSGGTVREVFFGRYFWEVFWEVFLGGIFR